MSVTVIAGLPIPSASPVFLAGVALHVSLGVTAVAAGAVAMLSRKGSRRHRTAGLVYFWSLAGLALSASALAAARWSHDKALFGLAVLAFGAALAGRGARRWSRPGWVRPHLVAMGGSYIAMLTAFYVDNGPNLPVWRALPPIAYWAAPALVGAPIILAALLRHPLARRPGVRTASSGPPD